MYLRTGDKRRDRISDTLRHRVARIRGANIHFVEVGEGPLIVLVHGWTNDWYGFWSLCQCLPEYRIVIPDLPGFGHSDGLDKYSIEMLAEYLGGFISAFDNQVECVCSLSMGSAITAECAARFPDIAKRLILMGAPFMSGGKKLHRLNNLLMTYLLGRFSVTKRISKRVIETSIYGHMTAYFLNMYHYDRTVVSEVGHVGRKLARQDALFDLGTLKSIIDSAKSVFRTSTASSNVTISSTPHFSN